jgi:hypothetical protein
LTDCHPRLYNSIAIPIVIFSDVKDQKSTQHWRLKPYEDDISAQEAHEIQGARLQNTNEHESRQRSTQKKKIKGKKEPYDVRTTRWSLFLRFASVDFFSEMMREISFLETEGVVVFFEDNRTASI